MRDPRCAFQMRAALFQIKLQAFVVGPEFLAQGEDARVLLPMALFEATLDAVDFPAHGGG